MSRAGSLLITGSTGMAGREITRFLLRNTDCQLTLLLHDTGHGLSRQRLLRELFRLEPAPPLIRRLRLVRCHLTKDPFGVAGCVHSDLTHSREWSIHSADTTPFDA